MSLRAVLFARWVRPVALFLLLVSTEGCGSSGVQVTKEEYGEDWPFTVDRGEVACVDKLSEGVGSAVFRHGGKTYALNDFAEARGHAALDPVLQGGLTDPAVQEDLEPLMWRALRLCGVRGSTPLPARA